MSNQRDSERYAAPLPAWWTAPGCLVQTAGVFLLPLLVALPAAALFETSEVVETSPMMVGIATFLLAPLFALQLLGLGMKSMAELKFWREEGGLGPVRLLDVLYRHVRVVTFRGWVLLAGGSMMIVVSLAGKWASFGTIAVLALLLFYLSVGWTLFVSIFLVRTFTSGMGRQQSGINRQMQPAVAPAGHPVHEVFRFRRIPIPIGYVLVVEDRNHPRLETETRLSVGTAAAGGEIETRSTLRRTPRGLYHLGPASISYQDILGVTKVSVASVATSELSVLPPIRPVQIVEPPRSKLMVPDVLTKPHRYATEDYFRFRQYQAGDDTRRIHWRLSMRTGNLQVRLPETKEIHSDKILLVLDSYLPKGRVLDAADGADEILDKLVLALLGLAKELVGRGHGVTLLAAAKGHERGTVVLEKLDLKRGSVQKWQDLGARVAWQGAWDVPALLEEAGEDVHGMVVTARFTAPPPGQLPGKTITWVFIDPSQALPVPNHWLLPIRQGGILPLLKTLVQLPHPVGSEENSSIRRFLAATRRYRRWKSATTLRRTAIKRAGAIRTELIARGDAVYALEITPSAVRLVGLTAGGTQ